MKKAFGMLAILGCTLSPAWAQSTLLETLVQKEIITDFEAQEIQKAQAYGIKWSGDLRLRYQAEKRELDAASRERSRFRLRIRGESLIADNLTAKVTFASGGAD